jgi:hypothetical protein
VDLVYSGFAPAFDNLPQIRLLRKVHGHRVSDEVLAWIASWLSSRKQRVALNGRFSKWSEVLNGGSIRISN